MEPSIRVLAISNQKPNPQITPSHSLKLSFFDHFWHFIPPNERVLFYNTNTHFPTLVNNLKQSLSLALHHFYPLAGKLFWSPESDEFEILCGNQDDSVLFLEAETDADFRQLADGTIHKVSTYRNLVPPMDISELPAPLLSVQVTRFIAGGICIGISFHHMVMDGRAFWNFMKSWGEICKTGNLLLLPSHDRSVIQDRDGLSKIFLDGVRTYLPKVKAIHREVTQVVRRTFQLSSSNIRLLKERAEKQKIEPGSDPVSTFVAVCAHAWICSIRARKIGENENTCFFFLMDCRSHLDPPMAQEYFGNCVKLCFVHALGRDLLYETGFGFAVTRIMREIKENAEDPLRDGKTWLVQILELLSMMIMITNVASSPRLRVYDTDFGWGRPSRVEMASINGEGYIVLEEKKDEEGGIQISISLAPQHMDKFDEIFLHGLHGVN